MKRKLLFVCAALLGMSAWAQTDVTSTYLTNPGFEGSYSIQDQPKNDRAIYKPVGWTVTRTNGEENDITALKNGDLSWQNMFTPANSQGGSQTYWIRFRWGDKEIITLSQTVTLPQGVYTISADGLENSPNGSASLSANGKSVTFTQNSWVNKSVTFSLTEETQVTIELKAQQTKQEESIYGFDNVKIVKSDIATPSDYEALSAAIEEAETHTAGFMTGEYAPYTNVDANVALATAKAINTNEVNALEKVQNATQTLTGAIWTANTEEVNAVYNGDFSIESPYNSTRGAYEPTGWSNWGENLYNTRIYNQNNKGSNTGIDAASAGAVLFAKFTTAYGTADGYTMPLKKGQYTLNFIYGGWNEQGTRDIKVYKKDNPSTSATVNPNKVTSKDSKAHTTVESWSEYNGIIDIPEDGDYVLEFYRQSTTAQNQIVISDIELYTQKEVEANLQITSVGVATFCAPFDVDLNDVEGVEATAYTAEVVDGWVALREVEGNVIPAGTAVVLTGTEMEEAKILTGVPTADKAETGCLVGNLGTEKVEVAANAGNYLLQNQEQNGLAWYLVDGQNGKLYIGVNRCYLKFSGDNAREFFPMDFDNPTGIDSIATEAKTKADGKYLVNGKIVVVKAGKVYEVK